MGWNHQMSSLSCAIMDAISLNRTLLVPADVCAPSVHRAGRERCIRFFKIFNRTLLKGVVAIEGARHPATTVWVSTRTPAKALARTHACSVVPSLGRKVDTAFWFQQSRHVDIRAANRWLRQIAPHTEMAEASVHLLRSGLFYHRRIKQSADELRRQIGGAYGGVHVRRSDKIICSAMADCEARDRHTRPGAIRSLLRRTSALANLPIYVASTEPAEFFAPLAGERAVWTIANLTSIPWNHSYVAYAIDALVLFGASAQVETFSHAVPWLRQACIRHNNVSGGLVGGVWYGSGCRGCVGTLHPPSACHL